MIIKTTKKLKQYAVVRYSRLDRVVLRTPGRTVTGPHIVPIPLMRTSIEVTLLSFPPVWRECDWLYEIRYLETKKRARSKVQH